MKEIGFIDCFGKVVALVDNEFLLRFPHASGEDCYLTIAEIVADILSGDFTVSE